MSLRSTIVSGLGALAALAICQGGALAFNHPSTRISSLGGDHVLGAIPDLYSDITVNPAYAYFADRLVVSYGQRLVPGYASPLPYLQYTSNPDYASAMWVDEISSWGIRLASWRIAAFAQWALNRPENSSSRPSIDVGSRYAMRLEETLNSTDDDFGRLDIVAARTLGDRYILGLRLQGWGYYDSQCYMYTSATDYYTDPLFLMVESRYLGATAESSTGRRISFDFQAGIAKANEAGPRTDLAIRVSLNRLKNEKRRYNLDTSKEYDTEGQVDYYNYSRFQWSDDRKGNLWDAELSFRHAFGNGIRVYAGGGGSACSYGTGWMSATDRVQWSSGVDQELSGKFDGDGSLLGGTCFFTGGKIFGIHETIDLYVGLHGFFARTRTKETPIVHYASAPDGEESTVRIDLPTRLESTKTSVDLSVPFSVEFRPASFFTFYSGFILYGSWDKWSTEKPMSSLFLYYPPLAAPLPGGASRAPASSRAAIEPESFVTDWRRDFDTDTAVTVGFSLHYRDRLFADVWTGSEVVPGSLTSYTFDIRYAF